METLNKLAEAVSNAVPESVTNTLFGENKQQQHYDKNSVPTQGPGHNNYGDKPLTTTTNETGSLTSDSSKFANLSHGASDDLTGKPHHETSSFILAEPLKDTPNTHKRADSGHAEYIGENTPRFGVETGGDGIRRGDDDPSLHTTEGYARPKFHGTEENDDGVRRADGRERVQFDSADGSSGSLRPSEGARYGSSGAAPLHSDTQYHKTTNTVTELGNISLNKAHQPQVPHTSEAELSKIGVTVPETYNPASNSATLEEAQTSQRGGLYGGGVVLNAGGSQQQPTDSTYGSESYTSTHPLSTGSHHSRHEGHHERQEHHHQHSESHDHKDHHHAAPLAAAGIVSGFAAGGISQSHDNSRERSTEHGLPSIERQNDVPREQDTIAGRQGYLGNTNSGEFGNISSRSGNDVGEATSGHSTGLAHTTQSVASQGAPITKNAHVGQQREGLSSSNEPRAQGGPVNHATTNAVPLTGGLTQPIGGPLEPSVGAHPASGAQPDRGDQGTGRPLETPDHPAGGAAAPHHQAEAGHQYVRSSGLAADGGDFDAAAPGAGREADRLLEQQGIHRTVDKRDHSQHASTPNKVGGIVSSLIHHGDHSSNKSNPAPHPATTNVAEPHPRTGHASGGISGITHTAGGSTGGTTTGGTETSTSATTAGGSSNAPETSTHDSTPSTSHSTEKKPLKEKVMEKLHLGGH